MGVAGSANTTGIARRIWLASTTNAKILALATASRLQAAESLTTIQLAAVLLGTKEMDTPDVIHVSAILTMIVKLDL